MYRGESYSARITARENTLKAWRNQFGGLDPCTRFFESLEMAWDLYEKKSYSPDLIIKIKPYQHSRLEIIPPKLPNPWDDTPDLIRARLIAGDASAYNARFVHDENYLVFTIANNLFSKAVEKFGLFFSLERRNMQNPYEVSLHRRFGDEAVHPYLIAGPGHNFKDCFVLEPIGACVWWFSADSKNWLLDWAWVHPFERSKTYFTKAWEFFQHRYGVAKEPNEFGRRVIA